MLLVWMLRVVTIILAVVSVKPHLAVELTSNEVCHKIKNYEFQILAMGLSRAYPKDDLSLWIIVEGGYMYSVPTAHLGINHGGRKAWLNIEADVIEAEERFNVPSSNFTLKTSNSQQSIRYFFTGNQQGAGLLVRMTHHKDETHRLTYQTYKLNGKKVASNTDTKKLFMRVDFVASGYNNEWAITYGYHTRHLDSESRVCWICTFKTQDESTIGLSEIRDKYEETSYLKYPQLKVNITTAFYINHNSVQYFVTLDDNFHMTFAKEVPGAEYRDKFELDLSDFIRCSYKFPDRPDDLKPEGPTTMSTKKGRKKGVTTEVVEDSSEIYYVGFVVVLLVGAVAYWWWTSKTKSEKDDSTTGTNKKKKNKGKKKKMIDPNQSSGFSSSGVPSSSPSSTKSKSRGPKHFIKRMMKGAAKVLGFHKSKAAKSVGKANKAKKKEKKNKSRASKGSMIGSIISSKDTTSKDSQASSSLSSWTPNVPKVFNDSMIGHKDTESKDSQASLQASSRVTTIPKASKGSMIGSKDTKSKDSQASTEASSRNSTIPKVSNSSMIDNSKSHKSKNRKPEDRKPKDLIPKDDEPESTSTPPSTSDSTIPNMSKSSMVGSKDTEPKDSQASNTQPSSGEFGILMGSKGSKDAEPMNSIASAPPSPTGSTLLQIPKDSYGKDHKSHASKPVDRKPENSKTSEQETTSTPNSPLHNQSSTSKVKKGSADGPSEKPKDTEPKKDVPKDPKDSQ